MSTTSDRNDPDAASRGFDEERTPQQKKYLVMPPEERAKGFVRPYRDTYVHIGKEVCGREPDAISWAVAPNVAAYVCPMTKGHIGKCRVFTPVNHIQHKRLQATGRLNGCDTKTRCPRDVAETYARDPKFYGGTYCVFCAMHRPLNEFVWDGSDAVVGT